MRLSRALRLLKPAATPFVIDTAPLLVVDDVLLSDLSYTSLIEPFKGHGIHAIADNHKAFYNITNTYRLLGLLPVCRVVGGKRVGPFRVPFLIGTGAPSTFFTASTIEALKLDTADFIEVFGHGVGCLRSSAHFQDINLLGTDVLRHGRLVVDYPARKVSLTVPKVTPTEVVHVWLRDSYGNRSNSPLSLPLPSSVHDLAAAVVEALPHKHHISTISLHRTEATNVKELKSAPQLDELFADEEDIPRFVVAMVPSLKSASPTRQRRHLPRPPPPPAATAPSLHVPEPVRRLVATPRPPL